jgi:hypothetical protein
MKWNQRYLLMHQLRITLIMMTSGEPILLSSYTYWYVIIYCSPPFAEIAEIAEVIFSNLAGIPGPHRSYR